MKAPAAGVVDSRRQRPRVLSDTSLFDFGYLGQLGAVPGWPGADVYPPQPMLGQLRALLNIYQSQGGQYRKRSSPTAATRRISSSRRWCGG
ncbi:MAG: hypothetical protein U0401_10145 [Anaerolineae bacterium]